MKILRKFCSDEVMTLIERMDTFPEEFVDSNKWDDFLPNGHHNKRLSYVERLLIQSAWDRLKENYYPRRAREEIIKTLMRDKSLGVSTSTTASNSPITATTITASALRILEDEFKKQYKDKLKVFKENKKC